MLDLFILKFKDRLPSEIAHVSFSRRVHQADDGVALALVEDPTRVQLVDALRVVVVSMEVEHANLGIVQSYNQINISVIQRYFIKRN